MKIDPNGKPLFPGEDAFMLHSSYGFPLEMTVTQCKTKGIGLDYCGFIDAAWKGGWKKEKILNVIKESFFASDYSKQQREEIVEKSSQYLTLREHGKI